MNKITASRLLVAAEDDAVLAAWVSVLHENRMPAHTEVSPYDHLEAFQALFSYGYLTSDQYNCVNEKEVFFSGKSPSSADVQYVLDNLKIIPNEKEQAHVMKKPEFSAFKNQSAIAPARPNNGLAPRPERVQVGHGMAPGSIQAFAPQANRAAIAPHTVPVPSPMMANRIPIRAPEHGNGGLACSTPDPMMMTSLSAQLICCGQPVQLCDVGGDRHEDPDQQPFIEYAFDATCNLCETAFCIGASKPYPRGSFT